MAARLAKLLRPGYPVEAATTDPFHPSPDPRLLPRDPSRIIPHLARVFGCVVRWVFAHFFFWAVVGNFGAVDDGFKVGEGARLPACRTGGHRPRARVGPCGSGRP